MRIAMAVWMFAACGLAWGNPCTNGSFEDVGPGGVPVDWQPMGSVTVIDTDAHSGQRCVRIVRTGEEDFVETGMNRHWSPSGGAGGAMIPEVRGGMSFWYKAPRADTGKMSVYVIPMNGAPLEETGSSRVAYVIPEDHQGDGKWHRGVVKYDFTDNGKVRWVHFAPRMLQPGELLLDDFEWLAEVGPLVTVDRVRLEESAAAPGERAVLHATVSNKGDVAVSDVTVSVNATSLALGDTVVKLEGLEPDGWRELSWPIDGARREAGELCIAARWAGEGAEPSEYRLAIAAELSLVSWGPAAPVAAAGQPVAVEALVENTGNALLPAPVTMTYTLGGVMQRAVLEEALAPGRTAVVRGTSVYGAQSPAVSVVLNGIEAGEHRVEGGRVSSLVVGADVFAPLEELSEQAADGVRAVDAPDYAALVMRSRALVFRRNDFGYGPGELLARTGTGWETWAWFPRLGTVVWRDGDGERHEAVPLAEEARVVNDAALAFESELPGGALHGVMFIARPGDRFALSADAALNGTVELLRFDAPMGYLAGRTEAIVPGVEWLVDDEVSSSTLDIAAGHEHQVRYTPDVRMFTMPAMGLKNGLGALVFRWKQAPYRPWHDGVPPESVQPVFASPDRFGNQRTHLFGIQQPAAPDFLDPNTREAARPWRPEGGSTTLAWTLEEAAGANLARSVTEPYLSGGTVNPAQLPRGSYDGEIQFSMNAFFESLWVPEENMWRMTKNGPPQMSFAARDPNYVADLLVGALHSPDAAVRARCRALVEEHAGLLGRRATIETLRLGDRPDRAIALAGEAAGLLGTRGEDGLWHFDADRKDTGVFRGMNYHELGEDGAVAVGNNADKARTVLRYARVTGDWRAYEAMVPVLEYFQTVRVPRAAQVWEVPFHTPDVLAASDAVECFLEAYWFSGEQRWLDAARDWAFKGLPFIYMWQQPLKPYTLGGSIPVFGATWYTGSWFARPVQWNGLRYADALLMLADASGDYNWRRMAETIIHSVFYQMAEEGEDLSLWPDSISVIDGVKSGWVFGPRMPITSIMKLRGESEVARTVLLGEGRDRIHLSALADVRGAAWEDGQVRFATAFPEGYAGFVMLSNVTRPEAVLLNGQPLEEREDLFRQDAPGWRYDEGQGFLSLQLGVGEPLAVTVEGVDFKYIERLPEMAREIAFEFDGPGTDGWLPANHVTDLRAAHGLLTGEITGVDPYVVRSVMNVDADAVAGVELRLKVNGATGAQFYWTTAADPAFNEVKGLNFAVNGDGEFHVYRVMLAGHPAWDGQRVLSLRIDPANGPTGAFALDYVRAVPR